MSSVAWIGTGSWKRDRAGARNYGCGAAPHCGGIRATPMAYRTTRLSGRTPQRKGARNRTLCVMPSPALLLRTTCLLIAAGGVALATIGMVTLSLPRMVAGTALWVLGIVLWERATGRFA